ncbi:MAG: cation diffusion facilitator family transporter [Prevotella sp.]|nr:cation diffusion facilitator family transporter [Prevotella sp.]
MTSPMPTNSQVTPQRTTQVAFRICVISLAVNFALVVYKLLTGIIGHSFAMISDALHSASDVLSTVIVMVGVKIANKQADRRHPYGHERFECVTAIILAMMLALTGGIIGYTGMTSIINGNYQTVTTPTPLALSAAVVSLVTKEIMFWVTLYYAQKIHSSSLKADAWHHRSDALSSIGSFVGILFAMLGYPIMDCVAAIVIALLILKVAVDIFIESINKMTDEACDEATETAIRTTINTVDGVRGIDLIKTRKFGDRVYVEVEIAVEQDTILLQAHAIAENVHDAIEANFPQVKHCTVHVNPDIPNTALSAQNAA